VLPDVNVTVLNKATNRTIVVKTSAVGAYQARDLAPGRYSIAFEKSGFSKSAQADVLLLLGKAVKADMELAVGTVATTVEISANAQLIDTSSTMVAHNVTAEELDNLPKARTFQGVALLPTSVNTGQLEGGYQINGATAAANNYYIDSVGTMKNVNNVSISELGPDGRILLYWGQTCASCVAPKTGAYGYYVVQDYAIKGSTGANINHFYVQDSWRILPRLTINVGLRTEKETIPSFQRSIKDYAFRFGWGDKLAPRIGASFDVFGDGRLKVSGAWGRFYDWTKYDLARGTFGAEVWVDYYRALEKAGTFTVRFQAKPAP